MKQTFPKGYVPDTKTSTNVFFGLKEYVDTFLTGKNRPGGKTIMDFQQIDPDLVAKSTAGGTCVISIVFM